MCEVISPYCRRSSIILTYEKQNQKYFLQSPFFLSFPDNSYKLTYSRQMIKNGGNTATMIFWKLAFVLVVANDVSGFAWNCASIGRRQPDSAAWTSSQRQQQHDHQQSTALMGLLDEINSGAYDLMSTSNDADNSNSKDQGRTDAYEIFLAELVFSTNDPRIDIANKIDLATDPEFLEWLEQSKIEKSTDPDERVALRDLLEMIIDVKTKVEVNQLAGERLEQEKQKAEAARMEQADAEATAGRAMSSSDVLRKATQIQTASNDQEVKKEKKTFYEQELTPEIRMSYEKLLKKVLPPYKPGDNPTSIVYKLYDQFDAQFVKVLNERATGGDNDSQALLEALAEEQKNRIATATDSLKTVLSGGEPMKMEGIIVKLAREGKIDETFLLLLEANRDQARNAGANGPADLMDRLRKRAIDEKDKQMESKEIRLLRRLLRTDDAMEREKLLEDAFTPRATLIVAGTSENARKAVDGEMPDQEQPLPDVPPPDFINACKAVLLNFGNLGSEDDNRGDLASRIRKLAAEAEVVATRIYGKGMTLREQQDRIWAEQTTSIWDLERLEIEAERAGEAAPWTNPNEDDIFMPGFDKDGRMQIGGS